MNQSPDPAWMRHMYCGLSSYDGLGTGTGERIGDREKLATDFTNYTNSLTLAEALL